MSFSEKIASLMARPGSENQPKDETPWWMKYAARGLGTVGGFIAIFLGVWICIEVVFGRIECLIGGMWQMLAGFFAIVCEAPCCCMFVDFVQNVSDVVERRPAWNKAAAFVAIAIPPVILCPSMSSIFGSGLIFVTGVIYGMIALGKKASAEEMRVNAVAAGLAPTGGVPSGPQVPNTGMRSTLVENAAPMAFTGVPAFDSNV